MKGNKLKGSRDTTAFSERLIDNSYIQAEVEEWTQYSQHLATKFQNLQKNTS